MSTKSVKKTSYSKTRVTSETSTPTNESSSSKSSRSSPLSPTRLSRIQEKSELQNLNDRLAAYIDKVRQLEYENNRLNVQVESIQESVQKEVVSMKSLYERELDDARRLLDDTAKERAQLQIDVGKLKAENDDYKVKFARKERDLNSVEQALNTAEGQVADLTAKLKISENEKKKALADIRDLTDEVNKLTRQLAEAKKQLEGETLMRVDLENRCQSLKEELQFKQQMFEKEISETKTQRKIEISEIDGRLHDEYENKLQEALQELRDQYEDQLRHNRGEVEDLYESKIEELTRRVTRGVTDTSDIANQLKESKVRNSELTSRISYLENNNNSLQKRVNDLEVQLDKERDNHNADVLSLKEELDRLRNSMTEHMREYQELLDVKIALDMEISAYRKLLESEEERLNLTPSSKKTSSSLGTPVRRTPAKGGVKRKRTTFEEDVSRASSRATSRSVSAVEVVEECPDGRFVRLENKGNKDFVLGGCVLTRNASGKEVSYKFHRGLKLPAGISTSVYSSDVQDVTHESPHSLVMKNAKWPVSDSMFTVLTNPEGEEIAYREARKEHEALSTSTQYGDYQRARLGSDKSPEKCCVM